MDENDELIDPLQVKESGPPYGQTFDQMILDNLRAAGVQQAHKAESHLVHVARAKAGRDGQRRRPLRRERRQRPRGHERPAGAERGIRGPRERPRRGARGNEAPRAKEKERRAAIFIGPEFGTVARPDLVQAAREAGDGGFDVLIACAFNYEAHASEFSKLGRIPVLKARVNADLHMGGELKATGKGNLFVVFGEPDIEILHVEDERHTLRVHVKGVDVFNPTTGEVRSDGADGIACWFIDTDYNEESFFVRHAYFLGQNDPYGALKTTLKAEINANMWPR